KYWHLGLITILVNTLFPLAAQAQTSNFFCGNVNSKPATMASYQGQNIPVIIWGADNYYGESGEDAVTRCTRVAGIFQQASQQGNLSQVINIGTTAQGRSMICANSGDGSCRFLYQVRSGENPQGARQQLLNKLNNPGNNSSPLMY
ncbi:MAG: COP23 domain-containing protein, partial [Microcoleaceae cyanobacterium]